MAYVVQQIVKTTAGWAEFDALGKPMLKDYWLFERVTETVGDVTKKYYKFKISDGVSLFADLPYQLLNGHSASINEAGNWLVYDDATQAYKDSGIKAIGVDGKSAFELWQGIEGNADKTIAEYFAFNKGEKGNAFTYADFTTDQIEGLKVKGDKGDAFKYADFTTDQIEGLKLKFSALTDEDKAELKGEKGNAFTYADFTTDQLAGLKGKDGQSAYLDAVAKGYVGTKDEFDTLLAGIGEGGGGYLDLNPLLSSSDGPVSSVTQEYVNALQIAYDNNVSSGFIENGFMPISLAKAEDITSFVVFVVMQGVPEDMKYTIMPMMLYVNYSDLTVTHKVSLYDFVRNGDGTKALMDNGTYKKTFNPEIITTATTLTNLSIDNYSIKVTLSSASALSFAGTPAEGWECMIDIKNTGSSAITQPLPNASTWQCEDTSVTIGAGKIASISVRYIHGTYVVIAKGQ